ALYRGRMPPRTPWKPLAGRSMTCASPRWPSSTSRLRVKRWWLFALVFSSLSNTSPKVDLTRLVSVQRVFSRPTRRRSSHFAHCTQSITLTVGESSLSHRTWLVGRHHLRVSRMVKASVLHRAPSAMRFVNADAFFNRLTL